ncbi:class I SAM-dependent methyltransferase [Neobacillus drentensis]|uniref:class I SAM-dependent methyltransferase n=1 Tax=Neobacillus drentensis TaxID=220684 RepID=UPI002FFD6B85
MQESKEQRVHNVFEKISDNYDKMNSVISFQQHIKWRKDTMKRMDVKPGSRALDVCCGTADWTIALAEAVGQTGDVTGLDFSQNMLNVGIEKVKDLVKIAIKDNGNGISIKNKVYIFEPGFTTKFDQAGIASNGIGLSYTKNVIEDLDGKINLIESSKEKGTTFEVQLPVVNLMKKG